MKTLFPRLCLAWRLLTARRFVLFLPAWPVMDLAVGGPVSADAWEAIAHFAATEHSMAHAAATARLLAAIHAEEARLQGLENDIHSILTAD